MTTREQAIQICCAFPNVYEDYPFGPDWTVMRHKDNKKAFAFINQRNGHFFINLKCDPVLSFYWRSQYPAVQPGYHMNKTHWITVVLDGSLSQQIVTGFIADSYNLTKPKAKKV